MLKSSVGVVRLNINPNSPRGSSARCRLNHCFLTHPASPSEDQHIRRYLLLNCSNNLPHPAHAIEVYTNCLSPPLPTVSYLHLDLLATSRCMYITTAKDKTLQTSNRHFNKHTHSGFSHAQKLVN